MLVLLSSSFQTWELYKVAKVQRGKDHATPSSIFIKERKTSMGENMVRGIISPTCKFLTLISTHSWPREPFLQSKEESDPRTNSMISTISITWKIYFGVIVTFGSLLFIS